VSPRPGAALLALVACGGGPDETHVAAASSLRNALPPLIAAYEAAHPGAVLLATYDGSGSLQRQIEGGAPTDVVLFASGAPVDALVAAGLVDGSTRVVVARNELVLVGPEANGLTFESLADGLPAGERVAIGEPGAVPAGQYAVDAFTALGTWDLLRERVVFGGDVAGCLGYARRGEVAASVVYATDARSADDVVVLDRATGPWAPRPEVVGARTVLGAEDPHAAAFLASLSTPEAQQTLASFGFIGP
jgi:molybdate transport system substrate-binding protein